MSGIASCCMCGTPLAASAEPAPPLCENLNCEDRYRLLPRDRLCGVCGVPLSYAERRFKTCMKLACRSQELAISRRPAFEAQQKLANEARQKLIEDEQREQERLALELRSTVAAQRGISDPERYDILALPSMRRRLRQVSARRKRGLREHLQGLVAPTSAQDASAPALAASAPDEPASIHARVSSQSCGSCRGFCCTNGGNRNAYIDAGIVARYRAEHPEHSASEVVDAYINRVGDRAYQDSCLYHGPAGCTLPREMRSDTCNNFYCASLTAFRSHAADATETSLFVVVKNGQGQRQGRFVVEKS